MFIASLFTNAKIRKQPKNPLMGKYVVYVHSTEYSAMRKTEIMPFETNEDIMLS